MSHMFIVERSFKVRRKAERWFESIRDRAWPYVWCVHDADSRTWNVTALLERSQLPGMLSQGELEDCTVRSRRVQRRAHPPDGPLPRPGR